MRDNSIVWEFILGEGVITYPTNYAVLCQINEIVEEGFSYTAGKLRSVPVTIGGSKYIPPIPFETQIKEDLLDILSKPASYEVAIELLLYVIKKATLFRREQTDGSHLCQSLSYQSRYGNRGYSCGTCFGIQNAFNTILRNRCSTDQRLPDGEVLNKTKIIC